MSNDDPALSHAKEQAREIMGNYARNKSTVCYSDLIKLITAVRFSARSPVFYRVLDEICLEEDAEGRGLLSVVVVRKKDGVPGDKFFTLAESRGRNTADREHFLESEMEIVSRSWRDG